MSERSRGLQVGERAPEFTLPNGAEEEVALGDFWGRPVVLAFYPLDWSPVCGDQLSELAARHEAFAARGAALLGISVDSTFSHAAYAEARGIPFPLLADFEPKGAVCRRYDVYRDAFGHADRALFLVDADGVIRWQTVVDPWLNPGVDEVLAALDDLVREGSSFETASV